MTLEHYRGSWPEPLLPQGEPELLWFEVESERDVGLRSVDLFDRGRRSTDGPLP